MYFYIMLCKMFLFYDFDVKISKICLCVKVLVYLDIEWVVDVSVIVIYCYWSIFCNEVLNVGCMK